MQLGHDGTMHFLDDQGKDAGLPRDRSGRHIQPLAQLSVGDRYTDLSGDTWQIESIIPHRAGGVAVHAVKV